MPGKLTGAQTLIEFSTFYRAKRFLSYSFSDNREVNGELKETSPLCDSRELKETSPLCDSRDLNETSPLCDNGELNETSPLCLMEYRRGATF